MPGVITIPADALSVDATQTSANYIVREGNLYDKTTLSDNGFTDTVLANITWRMEFDDLASMVQLLVVATAKMKLYSRVVGVDNSINLLMNEVQEARRTLLHAEIQSGDYSIFDSADVRRVMNRTQNPNAL